MTIHRTSRFRSGRGAAFLLTLGGIALAQETRAGAQEVPQEANAPSSAAPTPLQARGTMAIATAEAPSSAAPTAGNEPAEVAAAEDLAAQAYEQYQSGSYDGAIALYLEAYEKSPAPDILYNIARIYELRLRDPVLAATFYRRLIGDPKAEPERVRAAALRLAELNTEPVPLRPPSSGELESAPVPLPPPPMPTRRPGLFGPAIVATGALGLGGVGIGVGYGIAAMRSGEDMERHVTLSTLGFGAGGLLIATSAALLLLERGVTGGVAGRDQALQVVPTFGADGRSVGLGAAGTF